MHCQKSKFIPAFYLSINFISYSVYAKKTEILYPLQEIFNRGILITLVPLS